MLRPQTKVAILQKQKKKTAFRRWQDHLLNAEKPQFSCFLKRDPRSLFRNYVNLALHYTVSSCWSKKEGARLEIVYKYAVHVQFHFKMIGECVNHSILYRLSML